MTKEEKALTFEVNASIMKKLNETAAELNVSIDDLVSAIIRQYLQKQEVNTNV